MSDGIDFFDGIIEERMANVHTCLVGRIEKFDPQRMVADVQPLHKKRYMDQGQAVSMPLITNVPVSCLRAGGFIIRPPYQKGDIVLLVFSERDLDSVIKSGQETEPNSLRKHALDDALVVGGLTALNRPLPGTYGSDLLIAKDDLIAKIVITQNGNVIVETAGAVNIKGATISLNG